MASLADVVPSNAAPSATVGRKLLRFAVWGALWGLALGFGLLAPGALRSHHLRPRSADEWVLVDLSLSVLFAGGGAVIAIPSVLLATDILAWFGRRFRDWEWGVGLATGPVLVLVYALLAVLIGRYYLGSDVTAGQLPPIATVSTVLVFVAFAIVVSLVYRTIAAAKVRPPAGLLILVLTIATCVELASVPELIPLPPLSVAATSLPAIEGRDPNRAPLLFIGLDSGSWLALDRVMSARKLPTIEALASRGVRGGMEALWPPFWSSSAWGAILSGHDREDTGMYEDLSIEAPGLPLFQAPLAMDSWYYPLVGVRRFLIETGLIQLRVPPRAALARPPFWEMFALSGRQTAVIRLPYSHPADQQGGALVVSDWTGVDWQVIGVSTDGPGPLAAPAAEAQRLLDLFLPAPEFDRQMQAEFFPSGMPSLSARGRAAIEELRRGFTIDLQTFAAARQVAQTHPGFNVALYLGGWDTVNHAFWRYSVPDSISDPQSRADAAALGGVLDRYLIFLDHNLQQLLGAFASAPNVVIVSDHGFVNGWHEKHAMFLASGPGVPFSDRVRALSYFDVVPTLLDLQGLSKPPSLQGKSVFSK